MNSTWGKHLVYSLFGESHGPMIGITIHHLPAGIGLDLEALKKEMDRRRPGSSPHTTPRKEGDEFKIISGYFQGKTTGAPLTALIENTSQHSGDYDRLRDTMRPSHADYGAHEKYLGYNDYRGGGHFSGRLTAPVVFAGAIARQLLAMKGITIEGEVTRIGEKVREGFTPEEDMKRVIKEAMAQNDSVGGGLQVRALGVPAGLGEPFFNSSESQLAHLMYAIPAVKSVSFGLGEGFASRRGSEVKDEMFYEEGEVRIPTNYNGGIIGGITNGMPVVVNLAIKATSSIKQPQKTINVATGENTTLTVEGRHDPCIALRALPVAEAMLAIGLLELYLDHDYARRWQL